MFIVELTYRAPLEVIDANLTDHRQFLDAQYARNVFLASGPKAPRDGGIILASGRLSRSELDDILAQDPFRLRGLAEYRVTEFTPAKTNNAMKGIL